jgi:hypothetical protein
MTTNTITITDVETHLDHWFGNNWDNQSGTQVYAMVIDLLKKVNVDIISEQDLKDECDLNALENQSNE